MGKAACGLVMREETFQTAVTSSKWQSIIMTRLADPPFSGNCSRSMVRGERPIKSRVYTTSRAQLLHRRIHPDIRLVTRTTQPAGRIASAAILGMQRHAPMRLVSL